MRTDRNYKTLSVDLETYRKLRLMSLDFDVSIKEVMARLVGVIYNLPDEQKGVIKNMKSVSNGEKSGNG